MLLLRFDYVILLLLYCCDYIVLLLCTVYFYPQSLILPSPAAVSHSEGGKVLVGGAYTTDINGISKNYNKDHKGNKYCDVFLLDILLMYMCVGVATM